MDELFLSFWKKANLYPFGDAVATDGVRNDEETRNLENPGRSHLHGNIPPFL